MDKPHSLQALLNNTATEEDIALLKRLLASGEISIGGNVNQSIIIIGSGNTVELPPAALDRLNARPLLGNLDRDLTGEEIASGLRRLDKLLPNRAPVLFPHYKEQVGRLRPTLKTEIKSLSESSRSERVEALAAINSICVEALDVSFNGLCLGEEAPKYDMRSPFRGLESFRIEDREFFFGREALTQKLVEKIKAHSFLAVLGASGSGKSSLVMAGVIPALDSDYAIFRPGTKPLDELESACGKSLIVVDQFEELFTLTRDVSTRKDFIARLLDESTRARIILTLRSDFLGEVGAYRTLSAEIQNHLEIIPPMDMDELRRAMEGQAGVVGLRFEADLSQQILDDVAGEPGAMPLLQHALWELWNRRHGRNLRALEYRAFGGVKQAITSTAEKVYADCSKPEQDQVRDIFLRLTRLDESDEGRDTRRRVPLGDLIPSGVDAASISALLDNLANARLIVKTVNDDVTEIEVAHEALIRHWERLRIWLNEDRDNLRLREGVSEAAHQWEIGGRDNSLLTHRGARLELALSLGKTSKYILSDLEHMYLASCLSAKEREILEKEEQRQREHEMTLQLQERTKELEISSEHLNRMYKITTNFTQISAHELRTPLTLIMGYSQMLEDRVREDPESSMLVHGIVDGSNLMSDIVSSMLDVTRIDSNSLFLKKAELQIEFVVRKIQKEFKKAFEERAIQFFTKGLNDLPSIPADPELIQKVFYHLIMNAIKFTPDGGKVTVGGRYFNDGKQSYVTLTVQDTGIGIDSKTFELIFEKYYQTGDVLLHSSGKTKFKGGGPGLGLAIARGIIEAHGGRIWVESPGHDEINFPGSTFNIWLPSLQHRDEDTLK